MTPPSDGAVPWHHFSGQATTAVSMNARPWFVWSMGNGLVFEFNLLGGVGVDESGEKNVSAFATIPQLPKRLSPSLAR